MVQRSKRARGRKIKLLGTHQRCWLWGKHLVAETLSAGRWPIIELFLADDLPADAAHIAHDTAATHSVKVAIESRAALSKRCGAADHQGFVAKMGPFPYMALDDVLVKMTTAPIFLMLDGIQDPYNLGAILRSAEVFGVEAAFLGRMGQVGVNSLAARASAGAVNRLPIVQVEKLPQLMETLQDRKVQVIGASEQGSQSIEKCDLRGATLMVIGNEGSGICHDVLSRCNKLVRIPQWGKIGSLNAAAAAAVVLYEARRQRMC